MKKAFTLIELMVSISILSILMLFLYKSYADLNRNNNVYHEAVKKLHKTEQIHKVLYLDLMLASKKHFISQKIDKSYDFISFMTRNSLHKRINPYVAYLVKDDTLYRLESRKQIKSTNIARDIAFDIDKIGEVKKVKLYIGQDTEKRLTLLHIIFVDQPPLLLKNKILN